MPAISKPMARSLLAIRGDDDSGNTNVIHLLIIVLGVLVVLGLLLVGILIALKRTRRQQRMRGDSGLPQYNDVVQEAGARTNNHQRLTIETRNGRSSVLVMKDGQPMLANPSSPPHSPDNVPEIHITFPEEEDESGRRKSGRVLVVRVGDNATVGMEPLDEEQLPAYEKESSHQFYSIDMDDIGGLREKEREDYH
ncbi:hypothetical protein VP1G_01729 [Cytospora mali]|uniref:Uncharacterized protein n=1 Tax=Cytospora mali TaxID=578113 RepID=A0A194US33_CYTMA|nr:hypothetical protein VP1G_01729 [Valsa mali var. pyri (nom. inval.)]